MGTFDVGAVVHASPAEAWSLLVDTTRWSEWGPSIAAVESATRFVGPGSRGRVRTRFGVWLPFEVDDYVEGRRWSWRVAGLPATGHRVEPLEPGTCRVVFEVPVLAAPYAVVCRLALRRIERALSRR